MRDNFKLVLFLGLLGFIFLPLLFNSGGNSNSEAFRQQKHQRDPDVYQPGSVKPIEPVESQAETNGVRYLPPESFGSKAYYTGRRACELALKSPSSAKFSNPNSDASTGWQPFGYYQWKVFGQVDAKNPLGVLLREDWQAVVQYNVGQFEVVYLKVGAQESGTMPGIRKAPGN